MKNDGKIMEELKLCPFCGGEARLEQNENGFGVTCLSCGVELGYKLDETESEAINDWNTRIDEFCGLIRDKINTLKCWPGEPGSADNDFLSGVARELERLLAELEEKTNVVHGKWEEERYSMRCSVCKHIALHGITGYFEKSHFCPNCGSMDGFGMRYRYGRT